MADQLVLASPLVDLDDNGNQVVVAEEGDTLPSEYKDNEDEYIASGVLVPESYYKVMTSDVLKRAAVHGLGLDDVKELTKDDLANVQAVSDAAAEGAQTMAQAKGTPAGEMSQAEAAEARKAAEEEAAQQKPASKSANK